MNHRIPTLAKEFRGRLLDVGAGTKPYRKHFSVDEYSGTNTRRHYGENQSVDQHTDIWIEDASKLPLMNEEMDGVVCFQVLSVVRAPQAFFTESFRILKPGGKFLLTTDFLYPSWSAEDKARYSAAELKRLASDAGFSVKEIQGFGGIRSLLYMIIIRWIVAYYERIRSVSGLKKLIRICQWLIYLSLLPFISIYGIFAFLLEKNVKDNTVQTFNLLLFAEKPSGK